VSKQELKQTKNTNKHKQKSSTQKKKNKKTNFFSYANTRSFGDDATLCLIETNKVNFFNDATAMMFNPYIDTSFPQRH
jgi:hypothetical protein